MGSFDGHRGWVYRVAVHPDHRRIGIGGELVGAVERSLIHAGCHKLNLQIRPSDRGAIKFYERLGYAIEDRVSMGKRLRDE